MNSVRRTASLSPRLILCLTLAVAATACSDGGPAGPVDGQPAATAACGDVEYPAIQFGSHLIGDAQPPVPYSSTPPTSGWHLSGPAIFGFRDSPTGEPLQVNTLETGGVVVTHNGADDDALAALRAFADDYADKVLVTPYDGIDEGQIAIASWGAVQRCTALDLDALRLYADTFIGPAVGT